MALCSSVFLEPEATDLSARREPLERLLGLPGRSLEFRQAILSTVRRAAPLTIRQTAQFAALREYRLAAKESAGRAEAL